MGGLRGTARTCPECARSWGRRAIYCGGCGERLVEAPPPRADRGTRGQPSWRSHRVVALLAAGVVVVGAAVAVPTVTVDGSPAVDGAVALPTPAGAGATDRATSPTPTVPSHAPASPPSLDCQRGGEVLDCVAWTRDVTGPDGPAAAGPFGVAGHFGRTVLATSGRRLTAFDRFTGQNLWAWEVDRGIDGVRVESGMVGLVADGRFRLLAVTTGEPDWSVDVDGWVRGDLLYGGLVYTAASPSAGQPTDDNAPPTLAARRIEDGSVVWQWRPPASWDDDVPADAGRLPLLVHQFDADHVLVRSASGELAVLDASSGEQRWQREEVARLAADERGVVVREVAGLEPPVEVAPRDPAPPTVISLLDPATGHVRWRLEVAAPERHAGTSVQDDLVLVPTTGGLLAIDRSTGEQRWTIRGAEQPRVTPERLGTPGDRDDPPVVVTVEDETGRLRARDPATGEVHWELVLDHEASVWARPVGTRVVLREAGALTYVDAVTGSPLVRVRSRAHLMPFPDDLGLLFDLQSQHLVRLDPEVVTPG